MKFLAKLSLALYVATLAATAASGQVLFYDPLTGNSSTDLNGLTPSVTFGGASWTAGSDWKADGSFLNNSGTAHLPFSITSGFVYELSARITMNTNSNVGAMLQFGNNNVFGSTNLLAVRMDKGPGSTINVSYSSTGLTWNNGWSTEGGRQNQAALNASNGGVASILLDTTDTDWEVSYFYNGTLLGTNILTSDEQAAVTNFGVGMAASVFGSAGGTFQDFQLQIVPEPGGVALLVLGAGLISLGRRSGRSASSP